MLEEKQGFPQIIEEVAAWFDPAAIFRFQRAWPQFHAGLGREQPWFRVGAAKIRVGAIHKNRPSAWMA